MEWQRVECTKVVCNESTKREVRIMSGALNIGVDPGGQSQSENGVSTSIRSP